MTTVPSSRGMKAVMTGPLNGIRVLEVPNWLAAPGAGALLPDLGADVIKVEQPAGVIN